jgi:2-iminobutanoate/2-iminopropanoate deaminase
VNSTTRSIVGLVALVAAALPARLCAQGTTRQVIGNSTATLSPAVRWGDLLFVSGQLGTSRTAPDSTIGGQTKLALENLKGVLESAGTSMANVLKCTVFMVDVKDFAGMNTAYAAAFGEKPPARTTVVVAALVSAAARVEIECVAGIPKP